MKNLCSGACPFRFATFTICALLTAWGWVLVRYLQAGAFTLSLFDWHQGGLHLGFSLHFDVLSISTLALVLLLGLVIAKYSERYMAGEGGALRYSGSLLLTLLSAATFIIAGDLITLFLAWLMMSLSLHGLLRFYRNRPAARVAARKKFMISRLGDLFILLGIWLTLITFADSDLSVLAERFASADLSTYSGTFGVIGLLFTLGAMTKSAQVPFHFWLPETMESPTPVSALMHAGVLSAGGYLIIRLAFLIEHAPVAQNLLAISGAFSAVYAGLIMITQNDIKKKLAYSTISQMGIMLLMCGLGAYSLALFHIVAHSLYKSHAFLTTGALVNQPEPKRYSVSSGTSTVWSLVFGGVLLIGLGTFWADSRLMGYFVYGAILLLGLAETFPRVSSRLNVNHLWRWLRRAGALLPAVGLCVFLEYEIHAHLTGTTPISPPRASLTLVAALAYTLFVFGLTLANLLQNPRSRWAKGLYVYFWNEGYFPHRTFKWMNLAPKELL